MFSVIEKATGRWVGRVGPWQPEGWPGTEVGWSIARAHWGKGFAPEGATAATDWAFDQLGWSEVIHTIAEDNRNSKAVAAKLGVLRVRDYQHTPLDPRGFPLRRAEPGDRRGNQEIAGLP